LQIALDEAEKVSKDIFGMEIKNLKVEKVLVEEKLDVDKEYYVGVIIDASREVKAPWSCSARKGDGHRISAT